MALVFLASGQVRAEDGVFPVEQHRDEANFDPVNRLPAGGNTSVINGEVVAPQAFPASFYVEKDGKVDCTATLIGRRVLLTAAHCVADAGMARIRIGQTTVDGICHHHPAYKNGQGEISADYAICLLEKKVFGREPENLRTSAPQFAEGTHLFLIGFGCTNANLSGGLNGKLTAGLAKLEHRLGVVKITHGGQRNVAMPNYIATFSKPEPGAEESAIICKGDSGGAVYELLRRKANGKPDPNGPRRIVAVNSRLGKKDGLANGFSYLSATWSADFNAFLADWQATRRGEQQDAKICGRDERPSNCRS